MDYLGLVLVILSWLRPTGKKKGFQKIVCSSAVQTRELPFIFAGIFCNAAAENFDEIDRNFPPLFVNNALAKVVVTSGRTASLECKVQNLAGRAVKIK